MIETNAFKERSGTMVRTVAEHYADHLGPVYTWMVGDVEAAFIRSEAELDVPFPRSGSAALALDLGAGFGLHAIPLARRGYSVIAMDTCEAMLEDLAARSGGLPIRTVPADLADFKAQLPGPAQVIVCMGDTLTHLPTHSAVASLLGDVAASLAPGGVFIAAFRDYFDAPLQHNARFILVRADADRILTCFLEYADTTVNVHDLLHQRHEESWRLRVSSYPKLRLAPDWVVERLTSAGLSAERDTIPGGMIRITARKPQRVASEAGGR
jgi:2-polyprenyl-3-methyl-5-hydroxy-6-metoxy-1,4-benzoquinol methylase